jgi:hypothetical protein
MTQNSACVWCDGRGRDSEGRWEHDDHGRCDWLPTTPCGQCWWNEYSLAPCSDEAELAAVLRRISALEAEIESLLARADELLL